MTDPRHTLALETSGRAGSLAIGHGDSLLETRPLPAGRRHNIQLAAGIDAALRDHGITARDLAWLAVSLGPGSFTGLRIGITTAKVLGWATGVKLIGVPTIEAVARNAPDACEDIGVALNIKRDTAYAGRYARITNGWRETTPPAIVPLNTVADWRVPVLGEKAPFDAWADHCVARPEHTWAVAAERAAAGAFDDPATLLPRYAREPEAVTLWRERHGD